MYDLAEFRDTVERAARLLRIHGVRFLITDGAASIAYSDPCTTQDIDLVVDAEQLRPQLTAFLLAADRERFLFHAVTVHDAVRHGRQFQFLDTATSLKLDFYPRELIGGELDRATLIELFPGVPLPIIGRSDLVVSKLVWVSKGSHKSRRDVRELMHRVTPDESSNLRRVAAEMSMSPLLDEVLAEPDEIDA